jgi:hypothetical protein
MTEALPITHSLPACEQSGRENRVIGPFFVPTYTRYPAVPAPSRNCNNTKTRNESPFILTKIDNITPFNMIYR